MDSRTPRLVRKRLRDDSVTVRLFRGLVLLNAVTIAGTAAYTALGLSLLDAFYQTVITVSTVGYEAVGDDQSTEYMVVTIFVILGGVGTAFYTLGLLLETLVEGRLTDTLWRRRMDRRIAEMSGHTIVCGWGRVGRTIAMDLANAGNEVVIIDQDPSRVDDLEIPHIIGDATSDDVLDHAGISRAQALVAALDNDAANLYVTLASRQMAPDLFIVARAHIDSAQPKLTQAGANRVVNPQHIGGERMAAMILQPSVADFLDVVMHDESLEFRLEEVEVDHDSHVAGRTLRDAHLRDQTGALVLAMRAADRTWRTNPGPDTTITAGDILIAIGTPEQLAALRSAVK